MKSPRLLLTAILLSAQVDASTIVADFEAESDLGALRWASQPPGASLVRDGSFASTGTTSLKFECPAWAKGAPEWPAFEWKPAVRNWKPYDRLVVDVVNPTDASPYFALFVSDGKVPFRESLIHRFEVPERGFKRCVIPLAGLPDRVDRGDISILHFFTERPAAPVRIHLDRIALLEPGEALPEPPAAFLRQVVALEAGQVARAREIAAAALTKAPPGAIRRRLEETVARAGEIKAALDRGPHNLSELETMSEEARSLPGKVRRWMDVERFQKECLAAGQPADGLLVGHATSMEKILPRDAPISLKPAARITLSAARYEKESFQIVVVPVAGPLRNVRIGSADLKGPDGSVFPASGIQCDVVGYVKTTSVPPYGSPHVGWWPDPILGFLGAVDIQPGDLQSFWIRVSVPENQRPGLYQGTLEISADGTSTRKIPIEIRVRGFSLPKQSPLPVAITFAPSDHPMPATAAAQAEWRKSPAYPVNAWQKHKLRWADFLADYYINFDSLYRTGPPDFEVLRQLHGQGRLETFNLGIFDGVSRDPEQAAKTLEGLREAYRTAKNLGILDHAYIYGFDECQADQFPLLEKTAQTLRKEFPGVLLMTTSYDHSFGCDTVVKSIDAWCPLTPKFDPAQAAKARAAGKQVWWYICCGPAHPHANMFIEFPAIEGRLLMGAMTAKQRPDGFLYYQTSIWNSRNPITSGPFTDWDPQSWTTYHGDGSWTCVGPDGIPVPTIRLENFRDGLEDYAYFRILGETLRAATEDGAATPGRTRWMEDARAALAVPDDLVRSMTDCSRDPAKLAAWRDRMADLIEQAGPKVANPWSETGK